MNSEATRAIFGLSLFAAISVMTACGGPADEKLVTSNGMDAYRASLAPITAKLTLSESKAFDWAVSDLDLETLNARYPNGSVRDVVRGEAELVLETYPAQLKELDARAKSEAPARSELRKVTASNPSLRIEKSFFGLQPVVQAVLANGSTLPISSLNWKASLYIDGKNTPEATSILTSDFRSNGGFKPGGEFTSTFKVGFVRGDESWTTLAVRNAQSTRVVLEPILESAKDFANKPYVSADATAQKKRFEEAIQVAEKYQSF